jgi:hypothetical protein
MATNANETIYGPVADAAAGKYGIDPGVFRRLIASESSWDPYAVNPESTKNGENATGIAQFLPSTAKGRGVDPFDPYSALDGAAKYLSELTAKYGLTGGVAAYKGSATSPLALSQAAKVVGPIDIRPNGPDPLGNQMGPDSVQQNPKPGNPKAFYQYSWDDFKAAVSSSMLGFTFGLVGLLLIIFSVYMLTRQGGTDSVGAVKKLSGV